MFVRRKSLRSLAFNLFAVAVALSSACSPRSKNEPPNTLHVVSVQKISGLDPINAGDLYSGREVAKVYEGLLQYHYLKRPYVLAPNLAESMPQASQDGKVYTFKLKKGVLFQDDVAFTATGGKGRELTAEDFVYSIKRVADPKLNSAGWWLFDGKIVGLNEWREAGKAGAPDYSKQVEGLKAIDRYTIQVKLKSRSVQFLYALAMPFSFVVPREAVEHYGKEFLNHPVGTGPFRIVEYNRNSRLIWDRNPTYRKELYPSEGEPQDKANGLLEDAGKPIPLADRIVVQIIEETQPAWLNFMAGKLDYSTIPKDNYKQAITPKKDLSSELKEKGIRLLVDPSLDITHYSFNMADPLFANNKYLRQAMSLVYDQEKYNELFYNGRAVPAQGPIPPGLAGYEKEFINPYRKVNLEKAKELLEKAGYPGGKGLPPLEYNTLSDSTSRQSADFAQQMFGQLGIKLKVNAYSWPEFMANVKNKRGHLWSYAWGADYPDAENFLQLFYSKNSSPGPNDANYSNPEFDALYEKSLTLSDSPERTALYKKMVGLLVEDAPWIWGAHRLTYTLVQPWLKNFKTHEFDHDRAKYLRVDPSLKK